MCDQFYFRFLRNFLCLFEFDTKQKVREEAYVNESLTLDVSPRQGPRASLWAISLFSGDAVFGYSADRGIFRPG